MLHPAIIYYTTGNQPWQRAAHIVKHFAMNYTNTMPVKNEEQQAVVSHNQWRATLQSEVVIRVFSVLCQWAYRAADVYRSVQPYSNASIIHHWPIAILLDLMTTVSPTDQVLRTWFHAHHACVIKQPSNQLIQCCDVIISSNLISGECAA